MHGFNWRTHCQAATLVERLTKGRWQLAGRVSTFPFFPFSSLPIWRFFPALEFFYRRKRSEKEMGRERRRCERRKRNWFYFFSRSPKRRWRNWPKELHVSFFYVIYLFAYLFQRLQMDVVLQNRRGRFYKPQQRHGTATNFRNIATITGKARPRQM